MRLTYRTLLILLFITALIMAYCSTTADAGILKRIGHGRSHHRSGHTKQKIKIKTKHKTKTKIKVSNKKPRFGG